MIGVILGAKNKSLKTQHIALSRPQIKQVKQKRLIKKATAKKQLTIKQKQDLEQAKFLNKDRRGYTVLLSSFKLAENAENYAQKISKKGYDAFYFSKNIQGKVWHRVGVGSFTSKSTAESLKKELTENKLGKGFVIAQIPNVQES